MTDLAAIAALSALAHTGDVLDLMQPGGRHRVATRAGLLPKRPAKAPKFKGSKAAKKGREAREAPQMSLTPLERAFLEKLARQPQGRCSYALVRRDDAMEIAGGLLDQGHIRNRRLGYDEGFQITPKGRAYIEGISE